MAFRGAFVSLAVPQPVTSDLPPQFILFDTVQYDIGGWFNPLAPTRLTVPSGVKRVQIWVNLGWEFNDTGERQVVIKKNGAFIPGGKGAETVVANFRTTTNFGSLTGVLLVAPGDYFEAEAFQVANGGVTLNVVLATFSIESVPP